MTKILYVASTAHAGGTVDRVGRTSESRTCSNTGIFTRGIRFTTMGLG